MTRDNLRGKAIPQPYEATKESREATRWKTAWRNTVLERERLHSWRRTLGRQRCCQRVLHAAVSRKRVRGRGELIGSSFSMGKRPRSRKPREAKRILCPANHWTGDLGFLWCGSPCRDPRGDHPAWYFRGKTPRGAALERAYGIAEGAKPRRVNPKSGSRMEQAWLAARGARRREGQGNP